MLASRLTQKYQATVPQQVRKALHLKQGDLIGFDIRKKEVVLKKVTPLDLHFAKSLESTLEEWDSKHDEEAYREL